MTSRGLRHRGADLWRLQSDGWWSLAARHSESAVEVLSNASRTQRLFLPPDAVRFRVQPPAHDMGLRPLPDRTVMHVPYRQQIRYHVRLRHGAQRKGGTIRARMSGRLLRYVNVRHSLVPAEAQRLASEIRARAGRRAPQHEFAEAVRAELSRRYRYLSPGADGGARTLEQFFAGTPGHCEYFATALCVMLRSEGVPCRLVTGYRSDEWDDGMLTVRALHAHAWAEVLDPTGGWYTVDPSPAVSAAAVASSRGIFPRLRRWAEGLWARVTGFDEKTRANMVMWLSTLPRRLLWPAVGTLALGIVVLVRRRRREPAAVRAYHRALRRHKHQLEPGETPRQLVERVPELAEATAAHERERYSKTG